KGTWVERHDWVHHSHELIKTAAADPAIIWRLNPKPKEPFLFAAACAEYVRADTIGPEYETTLPVWLDASSNGLQHLALIGRDIDLALRVNLQPIEQGGHDRYVPKMSDIYAEIASLQSQRSNKFAPFIRDLVKQPIMTLPYGVTKPGMFDQIAEAAEELDIQMSRQEVADLRDGIWDAIHEA